MASTTNGHKRASAQKPRPERADSDAPENLRPIERLLADAPWTTRHAFLRAQKRARARAKDMLQDSGPVTEGRRAASLLTAGELFRTLLVEDVVSDEQAVQIARRLEELTGASGIALAREVLRAPELLTCTPKAASQVVLVTLLAFTPLRSASLWTPDSTKGVNCACHVGEGAPSRGEQRLARQLLAGQREQPGDRRLLLGYAVEHREQPVAALVGFANPSGRDRGRALMSEAVPMLAASVQREILLAENAASVRALVEASERKLTRLGFDLHDGPIQDVAVLGQDVRLFRDQLEVLRGPLSENKLVGGRIEDLEAQLVSLDSELRRLAREAQTASALPERPFSAAIRERIQAFTARTRIRPRLALEGDMGLVSPSQQIALLKVLQEALANVREHAEASAVTVRVSASAKKIAAEIRDDGRGFDVERTLRRTARDGRMGLTSMNERIHLLGGRSEIDSRPGGPTVVSVVLDRWLPAPADPRPSTPGHTAPRRRAPNAPGRRRRAPRPAGGNQGAV